MPLPAPLRRSLPWLWFAIMLVALFMPASVEGRPSPPGLDKLVHVLLFAVWIGAWYRCHRPRWWPPILVGLAFAALSEGIQQVAIPGREGSLLDLLSDGLGIGLGMGMHYLSGPTRPPGRIWRHGSANSRSESSEP